MDGSYRFIIETKGKEKQVYSDKYDVQIADFQTKFPQSNDIYEPGYQPIISQVTLYNAGSMPSPIHSDLFLTIIDDDQL